MTITPDQLTALINALAALAGAIGGWWARGQRRPKPPRTPDQ